MNRIILLDDEIKSLAVVWIKDILEDEMGCRVTLIPNADAFRNMLETNNSHDLQVSAFIVDMILAPGAAYCNNSHENHSRTGIFVCEDILKWFRRHGLDGCPIFLYSKIGSELDLQKAVQMLNAAYNCQHPIAISVKDASNYKCAQQFCRDVIKVVEGFAK
jgi:hypothetical protein